MRREHFSYPFLLTSLMIVLLTAVAVPRPVYAATITVDTTDDELNTDGDCSLREAIQAANSDTSVDDCIAGSGSDTITIPAGTYMLNLTGSDEDSNATGDLDLTADVTLNGAGARNTIIDGNATDRVIDVRGGTAVVNDLTIRNGQVQESFQGGGGIRVAGTNTLIINDSLVTGNQADTFGGGGGIGTLDGTITVINSLVADNVAPDGVGGGISSGGNLTIVNTTISNNSTISGGFGDGGGVENAGVLTIRNSTIAGNEADFGAGGIAFNGTSSSVENTIVTNNVNGDCGAFAVDLTGSNNLIDDTSCGATAGRIGAVTNFDTTLQDNGGPTNSHALLLSSNAIDSGVNGCDDQVGIDLATDQRGAARPFNGTCDIGAYEYRNSVTDCTLSTGIDITINNVTFNFSTLGTVTCVTVEEMGTDHLAATNPGISTGNWWHITADGTGFNTALTLPYIGADGNSRACRYPGSLGGVGWNCAGTGAAGEVTRANVMEFSDWAVGQEVSPTAVTFSTATADPVDMSVLWMAAGLLLLSTAVWMRRRHPVS